MVRRCDDIAVGVDSVVLGIVQVSNSNPLEVGRVRFWVDIKREIRYLHWRCHTRGGGEKGRC